MKIKLLILLIIGVFSRTLAQEKLEFDGQVSAVTSYAPNNDLDGFLGLRYIPQLSYRIPLDTSKVRKIDFEASANIYGNTIFSYVDSANVNFDIQPYRLWTRYTAKQFELRVGLQKIDFGSAAILRPLQWFNQIDPRDPLSLTNGVYGLLGRYYFLNNANIWIWGLYGNERRRGFDAVETYNKLPEWGGRFQYPTAKGEIALSYHYRTATTTGIAVVPQFEKIPENRIAVDGKWDLGVGLWFEAAFVHKSKDISFLTNQALFNVGTDYTFPIGNGLNVIVEHLNTSFDESFLGLKNVNNFTAASIAYPISLFDNLSAVCYYSWEAEAFTFFVNYEHQFKHINGYIMAYYNPETAQQGIQQNDLVNQFSGPGIRLMLVYNH